MNKVKRAIQSYCKLIIPEANKGIIVTELSDNRWEVIVVVKEKIYEQLTQRSTRLKDNEQKIKIDLRYMFTPHRFNVKIIPEEK